MPSPLDQPEQSSPTQNVQDDSADQAKVDQPPQPLAIEFGEATPTATDTAVQKLDLGQGDVVKLDALGPMIINTDGVSLEYSHDAVSRLLSDDYRHYRESRTGTNSATLNAKERSGSW